MSIAVHRPLTIAAMRARIAKADQVTCVAHTRFPGHVGQTYPVLKRQRNALRLRGPGRSIIWIRLERLSVKDKYTFVTLDGRDNDAPLGSYAIDLFGAYDDSGSWLANYYLPDLPALGAMVTGRRVEYVADPYIPTAADEQ
jgi:hypothetical protein